MASDIDDLKKRLLGGRKKAQPKPAKGLSTGSTLLNLACSGEPDWGILPGYYYLVVGDSAAGKTMICMSIFAEAHRNQRFADYRFVYDGPEGGAMMDRDFLFGKGLNKRMESPSARGPSNTVEEFYFSLDDALDSDKKIVYVLDSMDSLTSEDEGNKFAERKAAFYNGKQAVGSYGDGKAKKNSSGIRQVLSKLQKTGSILLVVSQTRDNVGSFSFERKTRSGGHALRFYATLELWLSIKSRIKKTFRGRERQTGILCQVETKKNRLTGQNHKVEFPLLWSYGLDDTVSCINFLLGENYWKKSGQKVTAPEFGFSGPLEGLAKQIEQDRKQGKLRDLVVKVWREAEDACRLDRERRYS